MLNKHGTTISISCSQRLKHSKAIDMSAKGFERNPCEKYDLILLVVIALLWASAKINLLKKLKPQMSLSTLFTKRG